ncbi:MAG: SET domain-containing protein [Candidatus Pacebacteria bacterium]|nr:SET domain-containing protein [Candidatus Paceibacterota bacterium]MBP9840642.1 SET domain-containing protein [Candidatus Paceibacterota bacterium]
MKKSKFEPGGFSLRVGRSRAGLGLFAGEAIPKDVCVIEYVGRVVSKEEEETSNSKYLFEVSKRKTIDGKPRDNKAGYINHSCRPNCVIEIRKERVYVFSRRAIREGEELNYDYDTDYFNEYILPGGGCRCDACREGKGRMGRIRKAKARAKAKHARSR